MPLTRPLMNKTPQVLLEAPVDYFHLTIGLKVICRTHFELRARHLEELLPEFVNEDWISIADYGFGYAVQLHNAIYEVY